MSIARARQFRRSMSPPEAALWNVLRAEPLKRLHFRRQVPIGPYYADFVSHAAKLVVEVDGQQHFTDEAVAHDTLRDATLTAEGYRILRVTTPAVLHNIDGVVQAILTIEPPTP